MAILTPRCPSGTTTILPKVAFQRRATANSVISQPGFSDNELRHADLAALANSRTWCPSKVAEPTAVFAR